MDELIKLDKNARHTIAALDKDTEEIRNLEMDEDSGGLHVNLWVWDSNASEWVRMTQPIIDATNSNLYLVLDDVEDLLQDVVDAVDGLEGSLQKIVDALGHYHPSDEDESGDPRYYGFLDKDGNWYIMEHNVGNGTYRYASGSSNYSTNWTGKAGLSYNYFSTEF